MAAALLAVVVGFALFGAGPAHAQGGDHGYVDVAVILEVPDSSGVPARDLDIIVMNNGSRTAYDVEVVVDIVSPAESYYFTGYSLDLPVGSSSLDNNRSLRWSIPALGPLQREEVKVYVDHKDIVDPIFDNSAKPHEHFGEVTTSSFESNQHKGNNTSRVWSYRYNVSTDRHRQAAGNYTVGVMVDDP